MDYKHIVNQYKKQKYQSSIWLFRWDRLIFTLVNKLNKFDGQILKLISILLGFQYDIYHKLYEVTYDKSYLANAERVKYQLEITLPLIGE